MQPFRSRITDLTTNRLDKTDIIKKDDPVIKLLSGYLESRKGVLPITLKYFIIQEGLVMNKKMKLDFLVKDMDSEISKMWERSVALYPMEHFGRYRYLIESNYLHTIIEPSDKSESTYFGDLVIYVDLGLLNYIVENYMILDNGPEISFGILDKYLLPKINLCNDENLFKEFMYNTLMALLQNDYIYKAFSLDGQFDRIGSALQRTYLPTEENKMKPQSIETFVIAYIFYMYNETVLRGNYGLDILNRFKSFMTTLAVSDAAWVAYNGLLQMKDSLGIDDPVVTRLLVNSIIDSHATTNRDNYKRGSFTEHQMLTCLAEEYSKLKTAAIELIRPKAKDDADVEKVSYAEAHRFNSALRGGILENEGMSLKEISLRKLSYAMMVEPEKSQYYFSEFLGFHFGRTDSEIINGFARKIDQVLIMFESMTNQWNKTDAMNAAYDLLNAIDDAHTHSTNPDLKRALEDLRVQLNEAIIKARAIDIKKDRFKMEIHYPQGYEG